MLTYGEMLVAFDLQMATLDPRDASLPGIFNDADDESRPDVLIVDVATADPVELALIRSWTEQATLPLPPIVVLAPAGQMDCSHRCEEMQIAHCLDEAGQAQGAGIGH